MTTLRDLRLDGNRLTGLPSALGSLTALTRLSADNNALVSLPASLSRLSSLRELSLENNRLAAPVVDVTRWSHLRSLQLHGNPLEFLPELTACRALRSLSLGGARVRADAAWSLWHVELAPPPAGGVVGGVPWLRAARTMRGDNGEAPTPPTPCVFYFFVARRHFSV